MKRRTLLVLALLAASPALAGKTRAQCNRDVKDFTRMCNQSCAGLAKKNQKAADYCKKTCDEQAKKFEKRCDNGK